MQLRLARPHARGEDHRLRALQLPQRVALEGDSLRELEGAEAVILATGVRPRQPQLHGIELPHVRFYPRALLESVADSGPAVVLGAGGIGVDVAHYLSHAGCRVTL